MPEETQGAQIRKASKGRERLNQVIVALIKEKRDAHRTMPASAFVEKLEAEFGPDAQREFDSLIVRGGTVKIPPEALGPCFLTVQTRYPIEAAGFDADATLASPDCKVAGLVPGDLAAKAGLLAHDAVTQIREPTAVRLANRPTRTAVHRVTRKRARPYPSRPDPRPRVRGRGIVPAVPVAGQRNKNEKGTTLVVPLLHLAAVRV